MAADYYQKVAYIALRNPDGSYLISVPLYVKVSELNKNGLTDIQEELIHRIAEKMMKRYDKQISEFIQNHSKNQGVCEYESNFVSG